MERCRKPIDQALISITFKTAPVREWAVVSFIDSSGPASLRVPKSSPLGKHGTLGAAFEVKKEIRVQRKYHAAQF